MKRTGIFDENNNEIVEGDTVEIILNRKENRDFLFFIEADKISFKVLKNSCGIGIKVEETYYKKNIFGQYVPVGTNRDEMNYCIAKGINDHKGNKFTKKSYKLLLDKGNLKLADINRRILSSTDDIYQFLHSFKHPKKVITQKGVTGNERLHILSQTNLVQCITLNNSQIIDPKKSLFIKLSKEAIDFVKERAFVLLEGEIIEGDFNCLIAKLKTFNLYEHNYNFMPCYEDMEPSYFRYAFSQDKYSAALK